ncbi:hypothetical protein BRARA_A03697 [Brassica rapa]|uniref:BnaAnng02860D protein n=4 Tax=Brassica TaxID=3705 RepID=A0A078G0J3_BRANA|nr:translationally controlled tumor protein 2 [Brassica rapa]XP_048626190.1 translationally controlled tumor protein 2-like [Brassica napus]RID81091.1 hypothetical protein BRARA_A03697 [Brassica rapa]CAG7890888.1 unnamed protein product [Brassica rapa]CDY18821.1 BnaAnng02860D [Brassica napus]VDC77973.1 unnamed protein product [Brassica rapa]
MNFDIGADPSAEEGGEDEGVDDQAVKVVDIIDTFRLQEQPPFDKKQFVMFMKRYLRQTVPKLESEKQKIIKKHIDSATKFLVSKLKDFQL